MALVKKIYVFQYNFNIYPDEKPKDQVDDEYILLKKRTIPPTSHGGGQVIGSI